ncbi:hypothetical protein MD484_g5547, partial [Candolleomyces efflorescens]
MSQEVAAIRPYTPQDEKLIRFRIGKANMELLASANNQAYKHPLFIAAWLALSATFVQLAGWLPEGKYGIWEYIRPLPALAAVAVPLLFAVDWSHRQEFEEHTRLVLQYPDLRQLEGYYSKSPGSGLWILEYGDSLVGLVAVDCSSEDGDIPTIPFAPKDGASHSKSSDMSPKGKTGIIRHFYVSERYRPVGIQDDLLEHAIKHAFSKDPEVNEIQGIGYGALLPYVGSCFSKMGFQRDDDVKSLGVLRWKRIEKQAMALLRTFTSDPQNRPTLVVFQSSAAQTTVPILRQYLSKSLTTKDKPRHRILFSLIHLPSDLVEGGEVEIHDWLENVPGYSPNYFNPGTQIVSTIERALENTTSPIDVVIDSIDTLLSDIESPSDIYKHLHSAHKKLSARPGSSLILHGTNIELISLVTQASFTSSLVHIKGHPTVILTHLNTEYLTPPPPLSLDVKFWSVFIPLSQRQRDVNELVFGAKGEGSGDPNEIVVEILVRGGTGRKRNVERELEAWSVSLGPCRWSDLEALKTIASKRGPVEAPTAADPTQNLSFNLSLTTAQQEARAQVPLPYAHEGKPVEKPADTKGAIFYDPDSADDLDDDDPDEDLDI